MADFLRTHFALTQQRLAEWLGIHRVVVAQAEAGQRSLPLGRDMRPGIQNTRITLASMGQMLVAGGAIEPAPPPVPIPATDTGPLQVRLADCRMQAARLSIELAAMPARAEQLTNRLAAVPALRGYTGPVKDPAQEATWLSLFENEALYGLRYECGPGPQALATARLAGLNREAEQLEQLMNALA